MNIALAFVADIIKPRYVTTDFTRDKFRRPVAGGGAGGGTRAPPEIFRLELNSATKVEFFY